MTVIEVLVGEFSARQVFACKDKDSIWVTLRGRHDEIQSMDFAPEAAKSIAALLVQAADEADKLDDSLRSPAEEARNKERVCKRGACGEGLVDEADCYHEEPTSRASRVPSTAGLSQEIKTRLTDTEVWDLNSSLAPILADAIRRMRDAGHGHPSTIDEHAWYRILTRMAEGFDSYDRDSDDTEKLQESLDLMKTWWNDLWD